MAKRKSYNPFKMWGAYVGGFSIFLVFFFFFARCFYQSGAICSVGELFFMPLGFLLKAVAYNEILFYTIVFIYGFILGWMVHSVLRAINNNYGKKGRLIATIIISLILLVVFASNFFSLYGTEAATTYTSVSCTLGNLIYSQSSDELRPGMQVARGIDSRGTRNAPHEAYLRGEGVVSACFYLGLLNNPGIQYASDLDPRNWQSVFAAQFKDQLSCRITGRIKEVVVEKDVNCRECTSYTDLYLKKQISPVYYEADGTVVIDVITPTQLACELSQTDYERIINLVPVKYPVYIIEGTIEFGRSGSFPPLEIPPALPIPTPMGQVQQTPTIPKPMEQTQQTVPPPQVPPPTTEAQVSEESNTEAIIAGIVVAVLLVLLILFFVRRRR